jgi:hypothetical protein
MKPPSLALTFVIAFWIVYGIVAAYALYPALPPVNRGLLLILGGAAIIPVAVTVAFLLYAAPAHSVDDRTC